MFYKAINNYYYLSPSCQGIVEFPFDNKSKSNVELLFTGNKILMDIS